MEKVGGYANIYRDLVRAIKSTDLTDAANSLNLFCNQTGRVEIDFFGRQYLLGNDGVHSRDGKEVATAHGSVLATIFVDEVIERISLDNRR